MVYLFGNLFNSIVILSLYDGLSQLRLGYFCAKHHQIKHNQHFE
jgi:hypothetical protein